MIQHFRAKRERWDLFTQETDHQEMVKTNAFTSLCFSFLISHTDVITATPYSDWEQSMTKVAALVPGTWQALSKQ